MSGQVISVSPFRCRVWAMHDRMEDHITEETCRAEIASFAAHGQLVPVLGRPIRDDKDFDIELVCGARRLFVARHLNKPLLVDVREMSDGEAIVAMDIENRQRADVSPYERGVAYSTWLRMGHFQSQQELARALKVSASQVCRLLQLARLPAVVLTAFSNPCDICEGWGVELADVLEDATRREGVIRQARNLAKLSSRPPPEEIFRQLLSAPGARRRPKQGTHDEVVKGDNGSVLFRIRYQRSSVALVLPTAGICDGILGELRTATMKILQQATTPGNSRHEGRRRDYVRERAGLAGAERIAASM